MIQMLMNQILRMSMQREHQLDMETTIFAHQKGFIIPRPCNVAKKRNGSNGWIHPCMRLHLHNFIKANVFPYLNPAHQIQLKTSAKVNGVLYCADPAGARSNAYIRGQHDWVSILWDTDPNNGIPAQIMVFLELPTLLPSADENDLPPYYIGPGLYATIASLSESFYTSSAAADGTEINHRCHQSLQLLFHSQLEQDRTFYCPNTSDAVQMPKLYADCHKFSIPIIAVPYYWKDTSNELEWIFIE
jgi:hypothetical protein